jgi:hypothetical protein
VFFAFAKAATKCFAMDSYATTHLASFTVVSSSTNKITILHCEPDDAPTATTFTKMLSSSMAPLQEQKMSAPKQAIPNNNFHIWGMEIHNNN